MGLPKCHRDLLTRDGLRPERTIGVDGATGGDDSETLKIVVPAFGVVGDCVGREAAVHETDARLVSFRDESDLDLR